jgi:CRISPR-associated protein Cas5h
MEKVLIFDIWADWGFFRKIETTSSPQSYSFPPRTTIIGIIAAFLGHDRDSYYELLDPNNCNIALQILNPIIKMKHNTNLIDTKKITKDFLFSGRTQVPFEYLKNPKYRIFFNHKDKAVYEKLKESLIEHKSVYTITLGLAGNIANYSYFGEKELLINNTLKVEADTVTSINNISEFFDFTLEYDQIGNINSKEIMKENMPRYFKNNKRECGEYCEYAFDRKTRSLLLGFKETTKIFYVELNNKKMYLTWL